MFKKLMRWLKSEPATVAGATCEETAEEKIARYERTLNAIATSTLTGGDFGDWVQIACEDALEGFETECPHCGTGVHEGPCVEGAGE
jgi:hypothetical protein